ncbi:hypothetical protein, partial [Hymenobacter ginsengisoli]
CDWECKGKKTFWLSKFRAKIFKFFAASFFQSLPLPVETGCKGTVSIFDFASDLKNFFFYSGCGAPGRYYPLARQKVPRPVRLQLASGPFAVWDCKGSRTFGADKPMNTK